MHWGIKINNTESIPSKSSAQTRRHTPKKRNKSHPQSQYTGDNGPIQIRRGYYKTLVECKENLPKSAW